MDHLGSPASQDLQVLREKMGDQERPARKAALVKWARQDLREARETLAPLVLLGRTA